MQLARVFFTSSYYGFADLSKLTGQEPSAVAMALMNYLLALFLFGLWMLVKAALLDRFSGAFGAVIEAIVIYAIAMVLVGKFLKSLVTERPAESPSTLQRISAVVVCIVVSLLPFVVGIAVVAPSVLRS